MIADCKSIEYQQGHIPVTITFPLHKINKLGHQQHKNAWYPIDYIALIYELQFAHSFLLFAYFLMRQIFVIFLGQVNLAAFNQFLEIQHKCEPCAHIEQEVCQDAQPYQSIASCVIKFVPTGDSEHHICHQKAYLYDINKDYLSHELNFSIQKCFDHTIFPNETLVYFMATLCRKSILSICIAI